MALIVLAYPDIDRKDFEFIQHYRRDNDKLFYDVVAPHVTIVFPVSAMPENHFVKEIEEKASGFERFQFTLRCATINKDSFSDYYHTFLVPDEGYSKIVKLHDNLYSGKLASELRLDIDFIPHIGIGNSKDKFVCKKMVDEWNDKDFAIHGGIGQITIVKYDDGVVTPITSIDLK